MGNSKYEEQMARRVNVVPAHRAGVDEQTTIRRCIELQARRWARVGLGEAKRFEAFVAR